MHTTLFFFFLVWFEWVFAFCPGVVNGVVKGGDGVKAPQRGIIKMQVSGGEERGEVWKTCRICKRSYQESSNGPDACHFHKGRWMGAENSKHMGLRSGGKNAMGVSYFWDCCDGTDPNSPGCMKGFHQSYDSPPIPRGALINAGIE
ncbi:unnamed protein product [Chrysoparadoxa australica]